ncbi:hypothetical protein LSAT2_021751 [Lamellibrachia satsuma]|nr:hypothetical protein LSAT2_021751 [Lamellibrachia satsuma]
MSTCGTLTQALIAGVCDGASAYLWLVTHVDGASAYGWSHAVMPVEWMSTGVSTGAAGVSTGAAGVSTGAAGGSTGAAESSSVLTNVMTRLAACTNCYVYNTHQVLC